ncbi:ABC-2 type transport system ATP-binding protein [Kibdelosporangium banguiense]|uniref:ABC-2 type transport system ATP-binding protein n=1 Tax=Kibdelosporangium banguiense TaxID=1365924 RepID=A0ABS4TEU2_9PSEU|nr:ATP-binding cassette domain-containing protein [Kibdelosporangium banguiense]MBP2322930.1 ABC-2 type transport system ATP-binding protein [Kibdelosporangium banguiense]
MHDGSGRVVVQGLTKTFGQVLAVQNLSFTVEPGTVTGFLGPNGAGKTTTLRMLLGLVTPTAGYATINGQPFHSLGNPGRVVGAVLEAQSFHPKRSARNHLRVYAAAIGVPDQRADEVLRLVGLADAAERGAGGFSMGMRQRLALATALLGDPQVLVLDEPANGLDPEGILWLRTFLQGFARSGRTVLVSSHLLAEIEQTVEQVVILSRGQAMYYGPLDRLRKSQQSRVVVRPADPQKLITALQEAELTAIEHLPEGRLAVTGATPEQVGDIALQAQVAIYGMLTEHADLERIFFQLTSGQFSGANLDPYQQQQYQQPQYQQQPPPGWQQQQPPQQHPQQPGQGFGGGY